MAEIHQHNHAAVVEADHKQVVAVVGDVHNCAAAVAVVEADHKHVAGVEADHKPAAVDHIPELVLHNPSICTAVANTHASVSTRKCTI